MPHAIVQLLRNRIVLRNLLRGIGVSRRTDRRLRVRLVGIEDRLKLDRLQEFARVSGLDFT